MQKLWVTKTDHLEHRRTLSCEESLALEEDSVATRPSEAAQVKSLELLEMIMNEKLDNLDNENDDLNLFICNTIL